MDGYNSVLEYISETNSRSESCSSSWQLGASVSHSTPSELGTGRDWRSPAPVRAGALHEALPASLERHPCVRPRSGAACTSTTLLPCDTPHAAREDDLCSARCRQRCHSDFGPRSGSCQVLCCTDAICQRERLLAPACYGCDHRQLGDRTASTFCLSFASGVSRASRPQSAESRSRHRSRCQMFGRERVRRCCS